MGSAGVAGERGRILPDTLAWLKKREVSETFQNPCAFSMSTLKCLSGYLPLFLYAPPADRPGRIGHPSPADLKPQKADLIGVIRLPPQPSSLTLAVPCRISQTVEQDKAGLVKQNKPAQC